MIKIVSGGQTGVDRAALDVAIHLEIEHGGWCPKGRLAEDGEIESRYALKETSSPEYAVRTEKNVIDSDGTLILFRGKMRGGTLLTSKLAGKHRRPCLEIDLADSFNVEDFLDWFKNSNLSVLNVAGPRASSDDEIYKDAQKCLISLFEPLVSARK